MAAEIRGTRKRLTHDSVIDRSDLYVAERAGLQLDSFVVSRLP